MKYPSSPFLLMLALSLSLTAQAEEKKDGYSDETIAGSVAVGLGIWDWRNGMKLEDEWRTLTHQKREVIEKEFSELNKRVNEIAARFTPEADKKELAHLVTEKQRIMARTMTPAMEELIAKKEAIDAKRMALVRADPEAAEILKRMDTLTNTKYYTTKFVADRLYMPANNPSLDRLSKRSGSIMVRGLVLILGGGYFALHGTKGPEQAPSVINYQASPKEAVTVRELDLAAEEAPAKSAE